MNKDHDYEAKKVELENLLNNGMIDLEMYRKEIETCREICGSFFVTDK